MQKVVSFIVLLFASNQIFAQGTPSCIANIINNDTTICTGSTINLNASFTTTPYQIGMNVGGGKLFFINPDGISGLVAAPFDQGQAAWLCNPGVSGLTSNDGLFNTNQIVAGCSENGAARICFNLVLNGFSDWYLPARDQLNLMFQQQAAIGGFNGNYYWSSTPFSGSLAWAQTLPTGTQSTLPKSNPYNIRAIRNFSGQPLSSYTYLWSTGANTPSISVSPSVTTTYYLTVSNGSTTCKDSIKVTVNRLINQQPASVTSSVGNNVQLIGNSNTNPISYRWQTNPLNNGWQNVNNSNSYAGALSNIITVNNIQISNHNQPFRIIATSGNCVDTSNVAMIKISDTCLFKVTDTLLINTVITSLAAPNNENIIKIYPNPTSTQIVIDYGIFSRMNGYAIRINNSLGQQVFASLINKQQSIVDVSSLGSKGLYFVQIIDPQNKVIDTRKIVLQ